jgi:hypothetical protein
MKTGAITLILFATLSASAQKPASSEADRLFREGRAALAEHDYDRACDKFTESQRLDPVVGTELNLAECEEGRGHLAAALGHWRTGLTRLKPGDPREEIAQRRAAALEPKVPRVTFSVGQWPANTTISWDGRKIERRERATPLLCDPGHHTATFTTGTVEETIETNLAPGDRKKLVAPGEPALAAGEPASEPADEPAPRPAREGGRMSTMRVAGIVVTVIGVAALITGVATTAMILGDKSTLDAHCTADHLCDPTGVSAAQNGQSLTTLNATAYVIGGIGAAVGIGLIIAGRNRTQRTAFAPSFSSHGAGFALSGTF